VVHTAARLPASRCYSSSIAARAAPAVRPWSPSLKTTTTTPCLVSKPTTPTVVASATAALELPTMARAEEGRPRGDDDDDDAPAPHLPARTEVRSSDHTPIAIRDPDKVSLLEGVTVVRDARAAARVLLELTRAKDSFIAWDTETTGVNPAVESPVGKGRVICLTAYGGHHLDFGNGPRLFVDCLDGELGAEMLPLFKNYFENSDLYKVWHNYSFDKHLLNNHGIDVAGFGGDTMHMARLVDTSRQRYSLEELCNDYLDKALQKSSMKERFGRRRVLKDGSDGKDVVVPSTIDLQRSPEFAQEWIEYAVMDAELTHRLMEVLTGHLANMHVRSCNSLPDLPYANLLDLYQMYFVPFGNMLVEMERTGFKVDIGLLRSAQTAAEADRDRLENKFREWAAQHSPDARYMNLNSDKQKQQFFFAPFRNATSRENLPRTKEFIVVQPTGSTVPNDLTTEAPQPDSADKSQMDKPVLKRPRSIKTKTTVVLTGLGLEPSGLTAGGWPSVSSQSFRKLAGKPRADPPLYGTAVDPATCRAIDDIMEANSVSTLLSGFIVPLQCITDDGGRIHASLNLNTETGRLSSRRPNLQNQPALEKDRYRIRNAFVCEPGNKLIVADYGQLELRLLAHITRCRSMIDAFEAGGDFHSRTALTMYDHVAAAVQKGDCLIEWNGDDSQNPDIPLLKDMFATERRRAKTLNFSIAYGKTAMGLSKDWGISVEEAKSTLQLWYKERKEVKQWQDECRQFAREHEYVETILGRRRHLPAIRAKEFKQRSHAERAAINAPLQGSAADLVMMAMINLHRNSTLRALGWRVILQIHDEIILEGPEYSAEIARSIVKDVMLHPLDRPLLVNMTVEPRIAASWFEAK
jgi:DNA polymerase I